MKRREKMSLKDAIKSITITGTLVGVLTVATPYFLIVEKDYINGIAAVGLLILSTLAMLKLAKTIDEYLNGVEKNENDD